MSLLSISEKELSHGRTVDSQQANFHFHGIRHFDWSKRWLKGEQYAHILRNIDLYCNKFGFEKFESKCHPECIYKNPINGQIYFVKGQGVGSEFGFPRVSEKKKYRWKKMNFTTDLPKRNPFVTYVVASAIKSSISQNDKDLPDFRMHAVIPYKKAQNRQNPSPNYILCHVRQVEHRALIEEQVALETCFSENRIDFYRLFLYLHNWKISN